MSEDFPDIGVRFAACDAAALEIPIMHEERKVALPDRHRNFIVQLLALPVGIGEVADEQETLRILRAGGLHSSKTRKNRTQEPSCAGIFHINTHGYSLS